MSYVGTLSGGFLLAKRPALPPLLELLELQAAQRLGNAVYNYGKLSIWSRESGTQDRVNEIHLSSWIVRVCDSLKIGTLSRISCV